MVTTAHSETMTADKTLAVYGKSFHWARCFLGQHMGTKAARLYQFCRVLDDMADGEGEYYEDELFKIFRKTRKLIMSNVPLESGNLKF